MGIFKAVFGAGMLGAGVSTAVNLGMTYSSYSTDRARGINPMAAGAHAIADTVLFNAFQGPILAAQLLPILPLANQMVKDRISALQQSLLPGFNKFQDSPQLQTTRGRAVEAIQNSRLQARGFIGQEAGLFAARYR